MKIGIGLCACVLVALLAAYGLKGGKPQPVPEAPVASVVVQPTIAPKLPVPATPPVPAVPAIKKPDPKLTEKKVETAPIKSDSVGASIGFAGAETSAPAFMKPTAPISPTTVETKPVVKTPETVLSDVISKPKYSKTDAAADEEEIAANTPVKTKPPATPIQPAETKPAPEVAKADVAAPDVEKKDDDDGLDKNGKPKKPKKSLVDNLFGEPEKPVKHEIEKKENPFAPKIIAVTVTEPMIMAFDIEKVGGNDRTMTEQIAAFMPNWRVRDANFKASKFAETHQGRDNVIVLNPLNDVLPAKLIATFEIPKSFATAKPILRFEVSNNNGKDWGLTVKAGGIDVIAFTKIKTSKDVPWFDVPVDLSRFADKHFDVSIEVNATTKHLKGTAPEMGYIRNIRFEWVGKKEGQGIQKLATPPGAGADAVAPGVPEAPPPPSIVPRK